METLNSLKKRLPSADNLRNLKDLRLSSLRETSERLPFRATLQRRIRLRGNSRTSVPLYVVLLFPFIIVILLLVIFVRRPGSPGSSLISSSGPPPIREINPRHDAPFVKGCMDPEVQAKGPRANAVFVVLARNKELDGVIESLKSVERHFNRWFHYPYVFLNDAEFNSTFKETVQNYTSGTCEFGTISSDHWGYPGWMSAEVAKEGIRKQGDQAIMYGGMESYHHMCRFYSGFFYKHELLQKYDWYWRVEPEIKYFCDMTYDPFLMMERENKTYGFTIAVKELRETVPNLFRYASAYKRLNKLKSTGLWEMFVEPKEGYNQDGSPKPGFPPKQESKPSFPGEFVPEPGKQVDPENMEGENYNMCHFWSNFEIARLDWFRSKEYEDFFQMMDRSGGFWMERWGDAPIHSLAAGALLSPKQVHYFRDYGYRHTTIQHCPANAPGQQLPRIPWLETTTVDEKARKEEDEYWAKWDPETENGVGCRCRCDADIEDVEGKEGSCIPQWVDINGGFVTPGGGLQWAQP